MSIRLLSTKAVIIELSPIQDEKHELEEGFSFDFNPVLDKENNKRFLVVFRGEQIDTKNHYRSKVVFISHFESEKVLDESNLTDKFLLINYNAIGYPYFRAFYSNFLLNAGYEPIILPTINFVKLADDKAKALSEKKTDSD